MTDAQWMLVLHVSLLILQALVTIVQGLLALFMRQVRREVRQMAGIE